jgi:plastocyanin
MISSNSARSRCRINRLLASAVLLVAASAAHGDVLVLTVTDRASDIPVSGAVVTLADKRPVEPVTAVMAQKDRAFHPHVLTVPRGSRVSFPNNDNTQHHVYSFSRTKTFNIALYAGQPEEPVLFDQPGIVELGCNIHDHMKAYIVVTDTPHTGHSDPQGKVRLALPETDFDRAQTRELNVWHPQMKNNSAFATRRITRPLTSPKTLKLDIAVEASPDTDGFGDLQKRFRDL